MPYNLATDVFWLIWLISQNTGFASALSMFPDYSSDTELQILSDEDQVDDNNTPERHSSAPPPLSLSELPQHLERELVHDMDVTTAHHSSDSILSILGTPVKRGRPRGSTRLKRKRERNLSAEALVAFREQRLRDRAERNLHVFGHPKTARKVSQPVFLPPVLLSTPVPSTVPSSARWITPQHAFLPTPQSTLASVFEEDQVPPTEQQKLSKRIKRAEAVWGSLKSNGYSTLDEFLEDMFTLPDQQLSAKGTRFLKKYTSRLLFHVEKRNPGDLRDFTTQFLKTSIRKEANTLNQLCCGASSTSVSDLLVQFDLRTLISSFQTSVPILWTSLEAVVLSQETRHKIEGGLKPRRDRDLIIASAMCMLAIGRNERANNFQTIIGLFLLGSGAQRNLVEVLAHAGLSVSYSTIIKRVQQLSVEALARTVKVSRQQMFMIVWDNINIAFRVSEQRQVSKDHFDNGTTGTLIPLFSPDFSTQVPYGTLPLELKPPRLYRHLFTTINVNVLLPDKVQEQQLQEACLWQLRKIAIENVEGLLNKDEYIGTAPEVFKIPLHQTEQFPLPAMKIDESSIDGTISVITTILQKVLGWQEEDVRAHGLLFVDGDLLTINLLDKVESARRQDSDLLESIQFMVRRFGLFHTKMAGCRLVTNQHWGKPNSKWAGSLWKENAVIGRKHVSAGWKCKKAAPWRTCHELLYISASAHIWDAFQTMIGEEFSEWIKHTSPETFQSVAERVFQEYFTSRRVNELRNQSVRDHAHENTLLYNRDVLVYMEFCDAIKTGDIGRVVNVLRVWMIMMRGENRMPKYADALFETLSLLEQYPPKLRELYLCNWLVNLSGKEHGWKEVDLLQEHQNFWAKVIYSAKGVNKSWEWLSMITVCIFVIRDAMRSVTMAFNTPNAGYHHSSPAMASEITLLSKHLHDERLHSWTSNRPGNSSIAPVVDLMLAGSSYPHKKKAFRNFVPTAYNIHFVPDDMTDASVNEEPDDLEDEELIPFIVEPADIADDLEGLTDFSGDITQAALDIIQELQQSLSNQGLF